MVKALRFKEQQEKIAPPLRCCIVLCDLQSAFLAHTKESGGAPM
jgi:hypothetical protein